MERRVRHRQPKGTATDGPSCTRPRQPSTLPVAEPARRRAGLGSAGRGISMPLMIPDLFGSSSARLVKAPWLQCGPPRVSVKLNRPMNWVAFSAADSCFLCQIHRLASVSRSMFHSPRRAAERESSMRRYHQGLLTQGAQRSPAPQPLGSPSRFPSAEPSGRLSLVEGRWLVRSPRPGQLGLRPSDDTDIDLT